MTLKRAKGFTMFRRVRLPHLIYSLIPWIYACSGVIIVLDACNWFDEIIHFTTLDMVLSIFGLAIYFWGCVLRVKRQRCRILIRKRMNQHL